jgi:GNAT superfamily N-acetyltransferase
MSIMSTRKPISVAIQPINYADIPTCSQNAASAFSVDPHTIVKQLGQEPYDMYAISHKTFFNGLERKTQIYVKAVDEETGSIIGHASWVFRGVDQNVIPRDGPNDEKPLKEELVTKSPKPKVAGNEHKDGQDGGEEDSLQRLDALEQADIDDWMQNQIPPNQPCIFINGLLVSPSHQSRGVGSALLQYGNATADRLKLPIWVHSSHQAYEAYKKAGFQVVRVLDIDLDEYAPRGPMEGEEVMGEKGSGIWGRYIIRYMQRIPHEIRVI